MGMLIFSLLLSGCERRELTYYSSEELQVSADWTSADLEEENEYGATLIFYPRGGGAPQTILMGDRRRTTVRLPLGRHYDVLLFNRSFLDFSAVGFRNKEAFHTLEAYARQVESRSETRVIVRAPEKLAVDAVEDLVVSKDMHFVPCKLTQTIKVTIYVKGLHNVRDAMCTMDGLPVSVFLATGKASGETASHTFELDDRQYDEGSSTDGSLSGSFNVFGFNAGAGHELEFSALLKDGKTEVREVFPDISISAEEDEKGNVVFSVEVIATKPMPDVDMGDAGLDADVDDWEDGEDCDIDM